MTYRYFADPADYKHKLDGKMLLVGLGAQKSGTTWLSDYLAWHPEVFMSPLKELHYFDLKYVPEIKGIQEGYFMQRMKYMASQIPSMDAARDEVHHYRQLKNYIERFEMRTVEDYLDFFRKRIGDQKVACEISPGYALLEPEHYQEMYAMHDEVRFLFIMRDPVDRFWSNLRFYEGLMPKRFKALEQFYPSLQDKAIVGRTDYVRTIDALKSVVREDHILTLFYEDLFQPASIEKLSAFCGIKPLMPDFSKQVLKSREIPITEEMKQAAYKRFAHVYETLYERHQGRIPDAWLESMRRFGGRQV